MAELTVESIAEKLAELAPLRLAESWDNVGLLLGDRRQSVQRIMTCLTITPEVVDEAVDRRVNLLVVHHPLPFKPLSRVTSDTPAGRMVLELMAHRIAVYSAHTAFDSAASGINALWAERLGLRDVKPLEPAVPPASDLLGAGRLGTSPEPMTLIALAEAAGRVSGAQRCRVVEPLGRAGMSLRKVAIACGSGGGFVSLAVRRGCDALITGEATFHHCLEARATGLALVLTGHYYSERFAMVWLAERLACELKDVAVFASEHDQDPLKDVDVPVPKH